MIATLASQATIYSVDRTLLFKNCKIRRQGDLGVGRFITQPLSSAYCNVMNRKPKLDNHVYLALS